MNDMEIQITSDGSLKLTECPDGGVLAEYTTSEHGWSRREAATMLVSELRKAANLIEDLIIEDMFDSTVPVT